MHRKLSILSLVLISCHLLSAGPGMAGHRDRPASMVSPAPAQVKPVRPQRPVQPSRIPVEARIRDSVFPDARDDPEQGFFGLSRPRVIVLIHGQGGQCDNVRCHLAYARVIWDISFVRRLLGRGEQALSTFSGVVLGDSNWPAGAYYEDAGVPHHIPFEATDDYDADESYPDTWGHHFVATSTSERNLSVMLTYRDASRSLEEQGAGHP